MTSARTRAREIALQALFCGDVIHRDDAPEASLHVVEHAEAAPDIKDFARQLVDGVRGRRAELDAHIAAALENWEVARLAVVDRNVLRLATYEFVAEPDIPARVTLNEAIELAKRFSTAQSGAFVNGILDRIRKDLGLPVDEGEEGAPPLADPGDDEPVRDLDLTGEAAPGSTPGAPDTTGGRTD